MSNEPPRNDADGAELPLAAVDPADEAVAPVGFEHRPVLDFPVVGIGASAGGLEAFTELFDRMPPDSGMAFVVVQHLPPTGESLLANILAKHTAMRVMEVEDGTEVQPNHVYVIRPGNTLTIEKGRLRLGRSVEERGHRRPVDDFFRSLAAEQKEKAIIVILSGMGSNGAAGAQAIKAAGGICIAQDPASAAYDSMPRSLIDAGYADQVLAVRHIPDMLIKLAEHPYVESTPQQLADIQSRLQHDRPHFNEILAILRTQTQRDFRGYKRPTLLRRIERRMGLAHVTRLSEYSAFLRRTAEEVVALANDLTINVTGFFRDDEAWDALRLQVIRPLFASRTHRDAVRAWVAGCSSGEEAYTLAIVLAEEAAEARKDLDIKVFATDTAERALQHARAGIYPAGIEGDIDQERIDRFFEKDVHSLKIRREIREMVVFAPQNLLTDPPFSRLDLVTCRNLLIYLEPETQRRVIALAHFALREGGTLFLGNSETPGADDLFTPVNKKWRIYQRVGAGRARLAVDLPLGVSPAAPRHESRPSLGLTIQRALTERYGPPSIVIDRQYRVVYFHGDTNPYIVHPPGEPTRNLWELIRDSMRGAARSAVRQAVSENRTVTVVDRLLDQGMRRIRITVSPLRDFHYHDHFVVSFSEDAESAVTAPMRELDVAAAAASAESDSRNELESELHTMRSELQSTIEELESSNEELKASNEEVTSVNEELQSTNEELETSKEELQSLNEELTTVNSQLQAKIEELESTTNDLTNFLSSTDIAVVFLDTELRVRRFTPAVRDFFDLIPSDIGRPINDLAQKFVGGDLLADTRAVLEKLVPLETEVQTSERSYMRRVLPYRTSDNRIAGVVVTFFDITELRHGEQAVLGAQRRLSAVIEQMPAAVLITDAVSGQLILANREAVTLFGDPSYAENSQAAWSARLPAFKGFNVDRRQYSPLERPLARSLRTGELVADEEVRFVRPDGSTGIVAVNSAPVRDSNDQIVAAVATFSDISARKEWEAALRESEQRFRLLVEGARDYAILMVDPDGGVLTWNKGAELLFGFAERETRNEHWSLIFTPADRAAGHPESETRTAFRDKVTTTDRWFQKRDGSQFWGSGVMTALQAEDGTPRGFLMILRDTTQRMMMERSLQKAQATAESTRQVAENANRAKDDFIATVSHELRTPLSSMLMWAQMFRAGKVPEHLRQEGLDILERSARTQQRLIDDLLDVSRMTSGKLRLSLRPTQLRGTVQAAIEAVQPAAAARRVRISRAIARNIGVVNADPDRIQQIVWNLLSNAVKFTPSSGSVTVSLKREGKDVILSVVDTGIGISAEALPRIFDRFRQGDAGTTRQYGGLGLGLAIARQLVELHGGSLTCSSPGEGKGSTFVARLPLSVQPGLVATDPVEGDTQNAKLATRHVLVVEDEETTRNSIEALLRIAGAEVTAVDSAAAAVDAFSVRRPDVVVSDIAMQDEDGYALIRKIRAIERESGMTPVPALALTAFARDDDRQQAFSAGFNAYESKPVDAERLVSVLNALATSQ